MTATTVSGTPAIRALAREDGGHGGAAPEPAASYRGLLEAMARILETGKQPARAAFLSRALNALADAAPALEERALAAAAGAASDYEALLQALQHTELLTAWRRHDPLAEARVRGAQAQARLLAAEGGALTGAQAAQLLGISRQAVAKRRRAGTVLAVPTGRRGYAYPAWQFDASLPGGVLPGVDVALCGLEGNGVRGPWTRLSWFLTGDARLGGARPLDALRRGCVDAVRAAAAAYGEQGAA
jgi:hypothetical protein